MIIQTDEELECVIFGGDVLSRMLGVLKNEIRPGVSLIYLDKVAESFILDNGCIPACKGYCGYPSTLCLSVNNVVVHGIPSKYELEDGDVVSVDRGVVYNGYYSDGAYTFSVGCVDDSIKRMLQVTRESLRLALSKAVTGNRTGDIGNVIESYVTGSGFSVVKEYAGHGVGKSFHEKPIVYNYGKKNSGSLLKKNMMIAIEPIVNYGNGKTKCLSDGWTVVSADGSFSAHYENTVLVQNNCPKLLSSFKYCE